MKNRFLTMAAILMLLPLWGVSQIDKIGYSKAQVLNSMDSQPCQSDYNSLWYCKPNGRDFIHYGFEYGKVRSVFYMWEYGSVYQAKQDVRNEIEKYTDVYGRPTIKGNEAYFFVDDLLIMISYQYKDGKHYSCWQVSD